MTSFDNEAFILRRGTLDFDEPAPAALREVCSASAGGGNRDLSFTRSSSGLTINDGVGTVLSDGSSGGAPNWPTADHHRLPF